jgi:hypothetical protein
MRLWRRWISYWGRGRRAGGARSPAPRSSSRRDFHAAAPAMAKSVTRSVVRGTTDAQLRKEVIEAPLNASALSRPFEPGERRRGLISATTDLASRQVKNSSTPRALAAELPLDEVGPPWG